MPKKWCLTTPSSPEEVACVFAADFVAVCKAEGDMLNVYRWSNVLSDLRRQAGFMRQFRRPVADTQRQAQLPLDVTVPTDRN